MPDKRCKVARCCGSKHSWKSKCTKHTILGPLLEVDMPKKRACGASTCGSHKHHLLGPFLKVQMWFCVADARDSAPCQNWAKRASFVAVSTTSTSTIHYTTTTATTTTLHYTTLNCTPLHYTSPRSTPLHYTQLHYATLPYTFQTYTSLIALHHNYNSTTLQLQLQLHYTWSTKNNLSWGCPILKLLPSPCAVRLVSLLYSHCTSTFLAQSTIISWLQHEIQIKSAFQFNPKPQNQFITSS